MKTLRAKRIGFIAAASLMAAAVSMPVHAATVGSIAVEGNRRVDAETIRAYVSVRPGVSFDADDVDRSLKALFDTGLFADVQIVQRGGALVVIVQENAVINRIAFEGNSKIKDEQLATVVLSKERGVYAPSRAQVDAQRLLEAYRQNGFFQATVVPKIIDLPEGRVNLVFEIDESAKTTISRINFIGNDAYSDAKLRDVIASRQAGLLSFIKSSNTYDPTKVSGDEDKLRRFYEDRGYADFQIVSTLADLDRERNAFFVTFTIDEGRRYRYGTVTVDSIIPGLDQASFARYVRSTPGDTYSAREVARTAEALTKAIAGSGFAFAQVTPRLDRNTEAGTVDVTYVIDEGQRAYIERIEVRGNSRTRDYVIRREFDVTEGDAYNQVLVEAAERRLKNLGYFQDVRVSARPGSEPDRIVVVVDVTEQATGDLSFGAGYSTADGILGDISISEKNFLGRGYGVRLAIGGSESTRTYEFGFTDPYFLGRRISAGFNVYRREYGESEDRNYELETTGGTVSFGFPITDNLQISTGYRLEENIISVDPAVASGTSVVVPGRGAFDTADLNLDGVIDFRDRVDVSQAVINQAGTTYTSAVNYSVVYATLDSARDPRNGVLLRFGQEFAGVGGDVDFLRTTASATAFRPVIEQYDIIGMLRGQAGHVTSTGDDELRLSDQFLKGADLVRGFKGTGIGPRDFVTGDSLGGTLYFGATAELQFPIPFLPRELGFSAALFADAGTLLDTDTLTGDLNRDGVIDCPQGGPVGCRPKVFGPTNPPPAGALAGVRDVTIAGDDGSIRSSVGASLLWASPIGPLRVDAAQVLSESDETLNNGEKVDQKQWFRFGGGTKF